MNKTSDLTKGNITTQLIHMAVPLIATSLIQTTYNLVDMIWIGRLGSGAVASIGTAGFFLNLAMALSTLFLTGTGIKIAQSFGAKDYSRIKGYLSNGLVMALVTALVYGVAMIVFRNQVIGFFKIGVLNIEEDAQTYLLISMIGLPVMYLNMFFTSAINSFGKSKISFKFNAVGMIVNCFLDPLLIFGIGGFLSFGVAGAAIASVAGKVVVLLLYINEVRKMKEFEGVGLRVVTQDIRDILKLGLPYTLQRVSFILVGMVMARLIAGFGPTGIAVQKIGLQIESISYMTIGGLFGAVSVFIGQNYGVGDMIRIREGYRKSLMISGLFGAATTGIFLLFPEGIFRIFLTDEVALQMGVDYLRIIGLSQMFMCIEIVTMASFNGVGKTHIPAMVSLTFTGLRIPLALYLIQQLSLGIDGVWWSISGTSMIKGVLLSTLFLIYIYREISLLEKGVTNA